MPIAEMVKGLDVAEVQERFANRALARAIA
jgi:hypothetical protein